MSAPCSVRVLLAGTGTATHTQHHQASMYLPVVRALEGFEVAGVLAPDTADGSRAADLAAAASAPLFTDLKQALAGGPVGAVSMVIACPDTDRTDDLAGLLRRCADSSIPVLVDKPTLLPTALLDDLAARFPGAVAGHWWRFHPALSSARGRVATGDLGLLHAVHGELLIGPSDGPHPLGELRNLAVHALDVAQSLIGDLHGRAYAVIAPPGADGSGEAITVSLRCEPDVAVSLLIGRSGGQLSDPTAPPELVHRYRILGSHGQLLVDLDSPAFDVIGDHRGRLPFGPSSLAALIHAVATGGRQPALAVAAGLAAVIDALHVSAGSHRAVNF